MTHLDNLTPNQLAILHKLTLWKYAKKPEDLITLKEYNELNAYLQGYAYFLQSEHEQSPIPKGGVMDSDSFREGMVQAKKEIEMRKNRA